jgi:hypothetical protein
MDKSCFTDKNCIPDDTALKLALGKTFSIWKNIEQYLLEKHTDLRGEWHFPGQKYGWSYRIKEKKRAVVYLLPRQQYFMVAFVFGQKATSAIMQSNISQSVKDTLNAARIYAEGRGIRIKVEDSLLLKDILYLTDIKREN